MKSKMERNKSDIDIHDYSRIITFSFQRFRKS